MIELKITLHPEHGALDKQLSEHMAALGFVRKSPTLREVAKAAFDEGYEVKIGVTEQSTEAQPPVDNEHVAEGTTRFSADDMLAAAGTLVTNTPRTGEAPGKRERGKPGEGRKRRTNAEIAEDEAADAAGPAEPAANISTGGERVDPDDVVKQDEADEKAETDAARTNGELTLDDVRKAVGDYTRKFGFTASRTDTREILGCALADLPETREAYRTAVDDLNGAIDENPFGRTVAKADGEPGKAKEPEAKKTATRDDLGAAIKAYMDKFGEAAAGEDAPKIFGAAKLGKEPEGGWRRSTVPEDKLGEATEYWTNAVEVNPFERKPV